MNLIDEIKVQLGIGDTKHGVEFSTVTEEKVGGEVGFEYIYNDEYVEPITITTTDIRTAWRNPLLRATTKKLEKFIFEGAELLVVPPDEIATTVSEEEVREVQSMVEIIDNYAFKTIVRMRQAWLGKKKYGSQVFERINGKIPGLKGKLYNGPVVFKALPGYSLDTTPTELLDSSRYIPGELLKGIVFDMEKFEISYWQRQGFATDPVKIDKDTVIHIKDETAESPDGESVFSTLIPLIKQLNFADKCLMRSVMRAGAPNLDVIIKEYRDSPGAMNADAWDMGKAYSEGKKIGQNWSNSTVLEHPDCIELKPLDWSKMAIDPIKVVNFISERILYALIPRDFTENKGIAISQTGSSSLDMLNLWARGEQAEIEYEFVREWARILKENGREGWRVEIEWRDMSADSNNDLWDRVRIARDVGFFTPNEGREIVGYPPLTDEQRAEIARMPAKGNNPGDKLDFDSSSSPVNPPPASFNDETSSKVKKGAKGRRIAK